MKTKSTLVLCVAIFMAIIPVSAAKYYLYTGLTNPWGIKGDGTVTQVTDLATTINAYATTDIVWIAAGNYSVSASIVPKTSMEIYGGFAGTETSLTDRAHSDLDGNGVVEPWEFTNATTLQGTGFAGTSVSYPIISSGTANFTLNGVTIDGHNTTNITGGAIYTIARPTITNCIIRNINQTGTTSVTGAGIFSQASGGPYITGCLFENCVTAGQGAAIAAKYKISIKGCVIRNNSALSGAGIYINGNVDASNTNYIINNVIYNNNATSQGGAIYIYGNNTNSCPMSIINNTIVNNTAVNVTAGASTGGIIGLNITQKWYNNIVYNNYVGTNTTNPTTVQNFRSIITSGAIDMQYTAYNGGFTISGFTVPATNNNSALATPDFVNPSTTKGYTAVMPDDVKHANFALKSTSVLKDAGTPSSFPTFATDIPTVDLLGDIRPATNTVDMGAYEVNPQPVISWSQVITLMSTSAPVTLLASSTSVESTITYS